MCEHRPAFATLDKGPWLSKFDRYGGAEAAILSTAIAP